MCPVLWPKQSIHFPLQCHCDHTRLGQAPRFVSASGMPGSLQDLIAHISPSAAHEAASFPPYLSHLSRIPEALLTFPVVAEIDIVQS